LCQWSQITLPVSGSVYKMQFINSNTGWAVVNTSNYVYVLIRTTNQGTNWNVIYSDSTKVETFQFINDTLGYALGESHGFYLMSKTTNSGYNWTVMQSSYDYVYSGFYMVSADTGWVNAFYLPSQVTLMTTNGFQTLTQISTGGGGTPATLYFFKEKYNGEYCGYVLGAGILSKTTNSGYNWQQVNIGSPGNINSFSFINKDTGWINIPYSVASSKLFYTSNSGFNWNLQFYTSTQGDFGKIQALNKNKVWCGSNSNKIFVTTNGGINWGYQISPIDFNGIMYFYDTLLGFAGYYQLVRTTNGGGPITQITNNKEQITDKYELYQNYPNPFNQCTIINVQLPISKQIRINIYDIEGKLVEIIVNKKEFLGLHSYKFNASRLSSGVYFYSLFIDGIKLDTKKLILLK
jgi:photosystem II stability/assembly factor-like uncharacterized protein